MQMLLKYEIYEIAKLLRNVEFRNFIKCNSNFEIVLKEFFLKKFRIYLFLITFCCLKCFFLISIIKRNNRFLLIKKLIIKICLSIVFNTSITILIFFTNLLKFLIVKK